MSESTSDTPAISEDPPASRGHGNGGSDSRLAKQSSQVKSATRTLDIIEFIVANDRPMVAQEIATALGIPVSSLSYLLSTLVERTYLVREGRRYNSGPGLERLQARGDAFSLADKAKPLVRTLRMQLNETTSFFVRKGWEVEATVTESSEQALRYSVATGHYLPMHVLASGKALLAAMPDEQLDSYFAETDLAAFTPATITSEQILRRQIEVIRKRGFATTTEEFSRGIHGIGRVVKINGEAVGALSVAIPTVRIDDGVERRVRDLLQRTAGLLESG